MTILQAITTADRLEPNDYSPETKLRWLSDFDGEVRKDVIDTHTGAPETPFSGYDEHTDISSAVLLVEAPYDSLYPELLQMKIHQANRDSACAEIAADVFMRSYRSFTDWYNRTHLPRGVRSVRF